ncbi:hypothetical protein E1258_19595 [Micromonospora sp. KC207]|nr:hypothetical protein E1258_19595 [Micromonospora sp. KC207]
MTTSCADVPPDVRLLLSGAGGARAGPWPRRPPRWRCRRRPPVHLTSARRASMTVLTTAAPAAEPSAPDPRDVSARLARLLYAFGEAVVPRVTLVTRKSYGGAYIAMNSRALGATRVLAWPQAEVAVMGAEAAVGILHRRTLAAVAGEDRPGLLARLIEEHERVSGGVARGLDLGVVDEVIDPAQTRLRVAEALAGAPGGRGHHGNIPL